MECKDENYNKNKEHLDVLIETLWNVKPHRSYLEPFFGSVLIETLWNVKIGAIAAADKPDMVLIETLWNVK